MTSIEKVIELVATTFEDGKVDVQANGDHFQVQVISSAFTGLNSVKRQQLVYKSLNNLIADGTIHAITLKTFTPEEWEQQQS